MILAIVNQKGGVAKSTSTIALGLHIARMGNLLPALWQVLCLYSKMLSTRREQGRCRTYRIFSVT